MANKTWTYVLLIFLVLGAGVTAYFYFSDRQQGSMELSDLIPKEAVLVYETKQPYRVATDLNQTQMWKSVSGSEVFQELQDRLDYVDTLNGLRQSVYDLIQSRPLSISMHLISKNEFGFIFYMPLNGEEDRSLFKRVVSNLDPKPGVLVKSRTYSGSQVIDISFGSEEPFSLIMMDDFLVGSYFGFLIEDVVRTAKEEEHPSLFQIYSDYLDLARIKSDQGDIFVNAEQLPKVLSTLFLENSSLPIEQSAVFSGPTFADLRWEEDQINLSGVGLIEKTDPYFLNLFWEESPQDVWLSYMAPNNTAAMYEYGFKDGLLFLEKHKKYLKSSGQDSILKKWYEVGQDQGIFLEPFFKFLTGNVSLGVLEKHHSREQPLLFLAGIQDQQGLEQYFQKIREKSKVDTSVIIDEYYKDYNISEIPIENFPSKLFGAFFTGFDRSFYTYQDSTLIVSNRLAGIRSVLNSLEDESNWGKSVKMNLFFENAIQQANVTAIFNTPRLYKSILPKLQPFWAKIFQKNQKEFKKFELIAAQWKYLDQRFYSNLTLTHTPYSLEDPGFKKPERSFKSTLPEVISRKPKLVKSHKEKGLETMVQLEDHSISLISISGKVLWNSELIKSPIICDPIQIDYFKNGKLQYLLITSNTIHCLDRLGRSVEGFPMKIFNEGNREIEYFELIDYEKTRDYRFLIADSRGRVLLMNKEGKKLEGWKQKDLGRALANSPFHTRINGKDILVFLTENGSLHAFKRNGNHYGGFPVKLNGSFSSPSFLVHGPGFSSSRLEMISDQGAFHSIAFDGKEKQQKQLIKEEANSKFQMVVSRQGEDFVITRHEEKKLSVISPEFDLMFECELLNDQVPQVQFYDFEGDHEIFCILEPSLSKMKFFNKNGQEYSWSPVTTDQEISLLYFEDQNHLKLYKGLKDEFTSLVILPQ